jgi:hypothetical protein
MHLLVPPLQRAPQHSAALEHGSPLLLHSVQVPPPSGQKLPWQQSPFESQRPPFGAHCSAHLPAPLQTLEPQQSPRLQLAPLGTQQAFAVQMRGAQHCAPLHEGQPAAASASAPPSPFPL